MEILTLQYLRGIAALMVAAVHLHPQLERMGYEGYWPHWMASGVDIFFVLSGFLMWSTTAGRKATLRDFYTRRIARIVPLYWTLTTVAVAVLVAAPQLMQTTRFDLWNVIASYFFVFAPNPAGRMEPVLTVGWTLNYEMLFYLVFGAALALPLALRFATVAAVLCGIALAGLVVPQEKLWLATYTSPIVLEFLFGMAVAVWHGPPSRKSAPAGLAILLLVLGFAAIVAASVWAPDLPRVLAQGVPATAIMAGALLLERSRALPRQRALHLLGDASYSVYLSHPMALSALGQAWRRLGWQYVPGSTALFCIAGTAVSALAGVAIFRLLEEPLVRIFRRRRPVVPVSGSATAGP